ncbi:MAG TPA: NosD domain-containing protein [Clostridia bacterium]|nr:NosD domain-containing protein [Clostridia bacterium]
MLVSTKKSRVIFILCVTLLIFSMVFPGVSPEAGNAGSYSVFAADISGETQEKSDLKLTGQIGGSTRCVAVHGIFAYVGVGLRLVIMDISDPAKLLEIGAVGPLDCYAEDISVEGNMAYIAAGEAGLYAVEISEPSHPRILGHYDSMGYAEGVALDGEYAYLADGPGGLRIIDISDPSNMREAGSAFSSNYAFDSAVQGNYVYIAAAGDGIMAAKLSDPARPIEAGTCDTPGYACEIIVSGNTAYLADGWEGLRVIDISDGSSLKEVGSCKTSGWAYDLVLTGNTVFVADTFCGVRVMDVSNRSVPLKVGGLDITKGHVGSLAVCGNMVYAADYNNGLHFIDISKPLEPKALGLYKPISIINDVAVKSGFAFAATGNSPAMRIIDVSDAGNPHEIASYDNDSGIALAVAIDRNILCINGVKDGKEALHAVDISDPFAPRRIASWKLSGPPHYLAAEKGIACVSTEFSLETFDVFDTNYDKQPGIYDFTGGLGRAAGMDAANGVAMSGNLCLICHNKNGLMIFDISNAAKPSFISSLRSSGIKKPMSVAVAGNYAFIGDHGRMVVADISEPENPREVSVLPIPGVGERMALEDGILYMACGNAGLQVIDIHDPLKPYVIESFGLTGRALGVALDKDHIYVAAGQGGMYIFNRLWKSKAARSEDELAQAGKGTGGTHTLSIQAIMAFTEKSAAITGSDLTDRAFARGQVYTVKSNADSGNGTFRRALESSSTRDTILFDPAVFPTGNPAAIKVISPLPYLDKGRLTIDASNAGVILDGSAAPKGTHGLVITSDYNVIKGLQVIHFTGAGIGIAGGSFNTIGGNRMSGKGPIGEGNVVSGNTMVGVGIADCIAHIASDADMGDSAQNCSNNRVIGNYIGTDVTGTVIKDRQGTGIWICGGETAGNMIGGLSAGERNIICGNTRAGLTLIGNTSRNTISGNFIGLDSSGSKPLGNETDGISIEGGANNRIEKNVISGNGQIGILIGDVGAFGNEITGNLIGTDAAGNFAVGNGTDGIAVNESFNRIGGSSPEERNIISGNGQNGIKIGWISTTDIIITGNYIGTDVTGSKPVGNSSNGITITEGTRHAFIGGNGRGECNLIGGNSEAGIRIEGMGTDNNLIAGNRIGAGIGSGAALPNNKDGILIEGGRSNHIRSNRIAYNKNAGMEIRSGSSNMSYNNSFINNEKSSDNGGNLWDNGKAGNYWSEYKGKDANKDGIGDTPHKIYNNGIDRYPLMTAPVLSNWQYK